METIDVEDTRRKIREVASDLADGDTRLAIEMLLASIHVGGHVDKVAELLDRPRSELETIAARLERNGIWRSDGRVFHSGWFDEDGGIALIMDAMCGTGMLEKSP